MKDAYWDLDQYIHKPCSKMVQDSLYLSFRPVFYLSKILGTMPLKLIPLPSFHFIQTWPCTMCSIIYFLLSLVHCCVTPYFVKGDSKTSSTLVQLESPGSNVSDYVSFIRNQTSVQLIAMRMMNPLIASFMSIGAQIVSIFFVRNHLPCFFVKMSQVDIVLKTVISQPEKLDFRITLYVLLYFFFLSLPVSIFYLFYTFRAIGGWEFIWNLVLALDNLISFSCEMQFVDISLCLFARFKNINKQLSGHIEQCAPANYFSVYRKVLPMKNQLTLQKIELIHSSNKKLCQLMTDLNSIYSFQLLCCAAGCFIKFLFNIYFTMFGQWCSSLENTLQATDILLWTVYYLMRFLVTTISASVTSSEVMETKKLISHINGRHLSKEIQEELNLFLNHLSSIDIKFTACGLLTVDSRLITAALATGTTYLVVLVQFRPQI